MALLFGATDSDRVEVADSASLRNLTAATYLTWAYVTATTSSRFAQKGTAAAVNYRQFGITTGVLTAQVFGATTVTNTSATLTNFSAWGTSKWVFVAAVNDASGASGDQKLYVGDLIALAAEPSAYTVQIVGSGATGDNTANIQYLGVNGTGTANSLPGRIAVLQIFNRVLTLAEIHSLQFSPRVIDGCVGYWILGGTTGTQADYSGNANAGTVAGPTVADHVPLPPAFGSDWYTLDLQARTLTGTQPAATGALSRVHHRTRSLAGSQPASSGNLTRLAQFLRSLTGAQPSATGVLARLYAALRALAGSEPTATGVATRLYQGLRALAGSQPTATGVASRVYAAIRSLTGAQPTGTGALSALAVRVRALVGAQPSATGALTRVQQSVRLLDGVQPSCSAVLTRVQQTTRQLTGAQPGATATLIPAGAPAAGVLVYHLLTDRPLFEHVVSDGG